MKISVIIPSYNSEGSLPATLSALALQDFAADEFEVIVVDCSSGDAVALLCAEFPQVRFQHENQRFNPGIGRNIGARLAQGRLLVFLDSDVVLASNALSQAMSFYESGHPVFGGCLELNEEKAKDPASYLEHFFFNHESHRSRTSCERSNLSSALMVFDRELFLQEGGFKDIPRMQDTELTERLRSQGHRLAFTPDVVGLQTQDAPLGKVLRKIYINGRNLYFIRYEEQALPTRLALGLTLPALSTLKVLRIMGRHLRYQDNRGRVITLALAPLFSISGAYWMAGLYRSMLGGTMSEKRD